jgi:PAS domain S-box-containing protein
MVEAITKSTAKVSLDLSEKEPLHVLHVDDDTSLLKSAKQCLETQGAFQIETALSVDEAMAKTQRKTYDVIVCDYQMPGKDGLEFLNELRRKGNKIPFIVFTGKGREEVAIKAMNLGADQYLSKFGAPATVYGELAHSIRRCVKAREAEIELRMSEEKYRNLFENSRDVTLTMDLKGKITSVNKAAVKYGFKKEEIIGKTQLEFVPKKYWPRLIKELGQIIRGKSVEGEIVINTPKGKKIAEYRNTPIIVNERVVGVQTALRDITERKKVEERLMESEERFRDLYESVPDALAIYVGRKGRLIEYNKAFNKWSGYSDEELKGNIFLDFVHPDDHALVLERYRTEYPEEKFPIIYEIKGLNKKGEPIPTEISVGTYKKNGKVIGINVMHRDITERKQVEEKMKKTLERVRILNEKLAVVGKLTRHDVRNKLATARMNIFLAEKKLAGNKEALKHLWKIDVAIGLTEKIFDFAGTYEKLGVEELTPTDVGKSITEAILLFPDLKGINIVNDCHGLTVMADSLLLQLFYNLIDNSLRHGENVRKISVYYEDAGKDQMKLVYEDDGIGIPENVKETIFKEGYGKGTGYGLYLMRKMCEVYGWSIRETGKHRKGVQFTIQIPRLGVQGKLNYMRE